LHNTGGIYLRWLHSKLARNLLSSFVAIASDELNKHPGNETVAGQTRDVRIDIALSVYAWPLQSVIVTDTDSRMLLLSSSISHQGLHIFTKACDRSLP
jgi:hypothetical protein